jgi:hypothetical protein
VALDRKAIDPPEVYVLVTDRTDGAQRVDDVTRRDSLPVHRTLLTGTFTDGFDHRVHVRTLRPVITRIGAGPL